MCTLTDKMPDLSKETDQPEQTQLTSDNLQISWVLEHHSKMEKYLHLSADHDF